MSSSSIDQEMLIEILKRLPSKSLLRCLCVSKSWRALITSPLFISAHTDSALTNANRRSRNKLLLRHYSWSQRKEKFAIYPDHHHHDDDDSSFNNDSEEVEFGFRSYAKYFEIVGSSNGLLCLCDTHRVNSHTVFLWNPTLRKSVALPAPPLDFKRISNFVHGFGFDSAARDYKVVKLSYHSTIGAPEVEIYELRKNSWRQSNVGSGETLSIPRRRVISELSGQAFLNGAVHWVGYGNVTEFRDLSVVAFDLGSEEFREIKLPEKLAELSSLELSLMSGNSTAELTLVEHNGGGVKGNRWVQHGGCGVWVMREYGVESTWMKKFNVEMEDGGVGKAIGLRKNGGTALIVTGGGEMVSYDGESGEVVPLGIHGIPQSFHLEAFVETLVLLNGAV